MNNYNSYLMVVSSHQGGRLEEAAQLACTDIITVVATLRLLLVPYSHHILSHDLTKEQLIF